VEQLRRAPREAFQNLIGLALSERVDFVLIAGDLYDGDWKDANTGLFFVGQVAKLRDAGIPVVMISGNHDAANKLTRTLILPEGIELLSHRSPETKRLDQLQVAIHGQSFARADISEDLSASYPDPVPGYFNIGLLHTSANGRSGHDPYAPCSVSNLIHQGYDYWALGHVHQREVLNQNPFIAFSGNIQGRHVRETGPKGCFLVTVDDDMSLQAEFRSLHVLRWERLEINLDTLSPSTSLLTHCGEGLQELFHQGDRVPLAVRVQLAGPVNQLREIQADREFYLNQIRSLALDVGLGNIWIEKLSLKNHPTHQTEPLDDSSLGELKRMFDGLRADPSLLSQFDFSAEEILGKMPAELRSKFNSELDMVELIEEAEAILFQHLIGESGKPTMSADDLKPTGKGQNHFSWGTRDEVS